MYLGDWNRDFWHGMSAEKLIEAIKSFPSGQDELIKLELRFWANENNPYITGYLDYFSQAISILCEPNVDTTLYLSHLEGGADFWHGESFYKVIEALRQVPNDTHIDPELELRFGKDEGSPYIGGKAPNLIRAIEIFQNSK